MARHTLTGDLYSGISGTVRRFPNIAAAALFVATVGIAISAPARNIWVAAIVFGGLFVWFGWFAPARCMAINRNKTRCRNNAKGWTGGCRIKAHRDQSMFERMKPTVNVPDPSSWSLLQNWGPVPRRLGISVRVCRRAGSLAA